MGEQLELFDLKPWTRQVYAMYTGRKHIYFYYGTKADPPIDHLGKLACWRVNWGPKSKGEIVEANEACDMDHWH